MNKAICHQCGWTATLKDLGPDADEKDLWQAAEDHSYALDNGEGHGPIEVQPYGLLATHLMMAAN